MRIPSFRELQKDSDQQGFTASSYATFMHPNPIFYKYYWWVFWKGSPCDGREFIRRNYRMPIKRAFDLMFELESTEESYWLYNSRHPRLDPVNTPFNPQASIWKDTEWAKSFEDDTDGLFKRFK